jgi:hypothetical protein
MSKRVLALLLAAALLLVLGGALLAGAGAAGAAEGEGEGESEALRPGVEWRLEQPAPPPPLSPKVKGSTTPIGLGKVGDLEFEAPNRGLLITPGNGNTVSPGLWAYNGQGWHELSIVCGATEGKIAFSGPEEFWTISDGRPGQAANPINDQPAPLEDRTLCHFANGEVVKSYASPAFLESSYQAMHAAACFNATDCWFGGDQLPETEDGNAFQLHWNGVTLTAEPAPQGHAIEDLRLFGNRLYEGVKLLSSDVDAEPETPFPYALRAIRPTGVSPFELVSGVPLYGEEEFPQALGSLHLGADKEALWAAAGPVREPPAGSAPAPLTVARLAGGAWTQILGPEASTPSAAPLAEDVVDSVAPEPGTHGAWLALDTQDDTQQPSPEASALVAYVGPEGTVETRTLPSPTEVAAGIGPKGAAQNISCPAFNDCWMTTTQGWLFHLAPSGERQLALDGSSAFAGLITFRPEDEGLPQVTPDAPPADDSGELPPSASKPSLIVIPEVPQAKVREALLSNVHSRLVHGTTLQLSFHLAVAARIKLIARRKKTIVASTRVQTFAKGNRKLLLVLNRHKWPTKLDLQTHALAPLPLVSTRLPGNNTVGTGVAELPSVGALDAAEPLATLFRGELP